MDVQRTLNGFLGTLQQFNLSRLPGRRFNMSSRMVLLLKSLRTLWLTKVTWSTWIHLDVERANKLVWEVLLSPRTEDSGCMKRLPGKNQATEFAATRKVSKAEAMTLISGDRKKLGYGSRKDPMRWRQQEDCIPMTWQGFRAGAWQLVEGEATRRNASSYFYLSDSSRNKISYSHLCLKN